MQNKNIEIISIWFATQPSSNGEDCITCQKDADNVSRSNLSQWWVSYRGWSSALYILYTRYGKICHLIV